VPELGEGQGQEGHRHRLLFRQAEPMERHHERRQDGGGDGQAVAADREPVSPTQDRLARVARRRRHDPRVALPHAQGERRKDVRHQIQEEDLQRPDRQRHAGEGGDAHDHHLAHVAREQIEHEDPDVAEDDAAVPHRRHDRGEGVVAQDDVGRLARDLGAAPAHRHPDVRLAECGRVVHAVARHGDDLAGVLMEPNEVELLLRADSGDDRRLHQAAPILARVLGRKVRAHDHVGP
jgi:hypothetical protein